MNQKRKGGEIILFILIGFVLATIGGFCVNYIFTFSCDYHEPLNEKLSVVGSYFYHRSSGHLEVNRPANWILWGGIGCVLGVVLWWVKQIVVRFKGSFANNLT